MKRIVALMLCLVLLVGAAPAALADSASNADGDAVVLPDDVPSPWAYDEVHQAIVLGMVPWDLQNHWRFAITRVEFAKMVVHFLAFQHGFSSDSSFVSAYCPTAPGRDGLPLGVASSWWNVFCGEWGPFTDLAVPEERGYGNTAYALGIFNGRSSTTFDPDSPITRQEAAAILMRCYRLYGGDVQAEDPAPALSDWDAVADWARDDAAVLLEWKVMQGSGGAFDPQGTYTREQAVLTLLRLYANAPVSRGKANLPEL